MNTAAMINMRRAIAKAGLTDAGFNMKEAGLGQVSQQSKRALPHLRHSVLQRKRFSLPDITRVRYAQGFASCVPACTGKGGS